jgi:hypothetical protein
MIRFELRLAFVAVLLGILRNIGWSSYTANRENARDSWVDGTAQSVRRLKVSDIGDPQDLDRRPTDPARYVTGSRGKAGDLEVDDIWGDQPSRTIGARLSLGVSSHFIFVLVVVNTNHIADYTIGSLSDYIGLLSLPQIQLIDGCGELPSILDLMAAACKLEKSDSITGGGIA